MAGRAIDLEGSRFLGLLMDIATTSTSVIAEVAVR